MPFLANKPNPSSAERRPAAPAASPIQVIVLVNGKPVSVTIAEGPLAESGSQERDHPPEPALDYLPKD